MSLREQIRTDLKEAMKAGDAKKRDTLRMLDASIKNEEIAAHAREEGLDDGQVVALVKRAVKQRADAREQYVGGGRADLAENEQSEIDVLSVYLPEQMDTETLRSIVGDVITEVGAAGPGDMGRVMGAVMGRVGDAADGGTVRTMVQDELSKLAV